MPDFLTDDPVVQFFLNLYATTSRFPFGFMEVLLSGIIIVIIVGVEKVWDWITTLATLFKR